MIRAGDAYNVIPQTAELCGTIRTFEKETRDLVLTRFKEVVERVSLAMGCEATIETWGLTPSVINNPIISQVVETILGQTGITQIDTQSRTMVSEDMALFLNQVPGCFLMVGSANEENGLNFAHHHPMFNFDENALVLGAGLMSASAIGLLDQQPSV